MSPISPLNKFAVLTQNVRAKRSFLLLLAFGLIALTSCGRGERSVGIVEIESIEVTPDDLHLEIGHTVQLFVTSLYSDGSAVAVEDYLEWRSADMTIVSVSPHGVVKGLRDGTTEVIVTELTTGFTVRAAVAVGEVEEPTPEPEPTSPVTSIAIHPNSLTLNPGDTDTLSLVGTTEEGTTVTLTESVVWESSLIAVATISENGVVQALATGMTTIKATYGGLEASLSLTVVPEVLPVNLVSLSLTPANPTVVISQSVQLNVRGHYSDSTSQILSEGIVWSTSDDTIAAVTETGLVTTLAVGSVTITATHTSSELETSTALTVADVISGGDGTEESPIAINPPGNHSATISAGESMYYAVNISPNSRYDIWVTNIVGDDLGLWVHGPDSDFDVANPVCTSLSLDSDKDGLCSFQASNSGTLYFRVSGVLSDLSGSFNVRVEETPINDLASNSAPVVVNADLKQWFLYSITTTPGSSYDIRLTDLDGDADLYVYGIDNTFSSAVCQSTVEGETEESCLSQSASGNKIYFAVDATKSWIGTTYSVTVQ